MALIALGLRRAIAIKMMPKAFKAGMSVSSFRQMLRSKDLQYRWSTILGDWRSTNQIEVKKDAYKYIRKDRLPSPRFMSEEHWGYSKEYVYRAKTWSRIHPDEPLTERVVTLQADKPLTALQVEEQIATKWAVWEYKPEKLERVQTTAFVHITPDPLEPEG